MSGAAYRRERELEEGGRKRPESYGYGGAAVSARPIKRARQQVEACEDESLREQEKETLHGMGLITASPSTRVPQVRRAGLDAAKLKEIRSLYGNQDRGGAARIENAQGAHRRRSATRCVPHRRWRRPCVCGARKRDAVPRRAPRERFGREQDACSSTRVEDALRTGVPRRGNRVLWDGRSSARIKD